MPARPGRPRRTGHGDGSGPNLPVQPTGAANSQGAEPRTSPPAAGVPGVNSQRSQARNLIPWTCHLQRLELHLSTHVSSHAQEHSKQGHGNGSPPVLQPSQLITDREGVFGLDQFGHGNRSGCPLLVVSSAELVAMVGVFRSCWSIATGGTCSRWRRGLAGAVVIWADANVLCMHGP